MRNMSSETFMFTSLTDCARDTIMYFPARGMTVSEVCLPNGNYRPNQIAGNVTYCVDSDGYQLEKEDWLPQCLT